MIATIVEFKRRFRLSSCTTTAGRIFEPVPDTKAMGNKTTSPRLAFGPVLIVFVVDIHGGIVPTGLSSGFGVQRIHLASIKLLLEKQRADLLELVRRNQVVHLVILIVDHRNWRYLTCDQFLSLFIA